MIKWAQNEASLFLQHHKTSPCLISQSYKVVLVLYMKLDQHTCMNEMLGWHILLLNTGKTKLITGVCCCFFNLVQIMGLMTLSPAMLDFNYKEPLNIRKNIYI